jgi:protein TonB
LPRVSPPPARLAAEPAGEETAAPIEAVAPVGLVAVEEDGGRKSRTLLYAAIAALVVIAILTFWFLNHRKTPAPATPAVPTAATGSPAAPQPSVANPAPAPAVPAAAGSSAVDLKAMVDRQLAGKEEELRKKNEAKLKELEKQVAAAAAGKGTTPTPGTKPPLPAPSAAAAKPAVPEPVPQAAPPPHPPEPAKAEEKVPAPAPAAPAPSVEAPKREAEPAAPRTKVGELVEMGPGVVPPQLVSSPKPGYPPMARTLRVEGVVVCSVLVDENGEVQDVKIAESIKKNVGLNEAAVSAARASHYKPASKDGVRVKMWTRLKIPFKL